MTKLWKGHAVEGECAWCGEPIKIVGTIAPNTPVYVHTNDGRHPDEPERCGGIEPSFATHPNELELV